MLRRRALLLATAALPAAAPLTPRAPRKPRAGAARPAAPDVVVATGSPATTPIGPLDTAARFAIVLDYNTNTMLLDKDADASMTPSSMTKLMTAYVIYGLLKSGRLSLTQSFEVSERAWKMEGSRMFVPLHSMVRVDDLIQGMIVQSGNDACVVLAEGIAGSEPQFVELMNAKARELGLTKSTFKNSNGLPDPDHRMSPRDIATLARRIIQDFPEYYHYDGQRSFTFNGITQENRNPLVQKGTADGLKTGHTKDGGFGLVASADRGGRRVIVVLNGLDSNHERGEEGERLLDWAFASFENVRLFTAGDTVEEAPVWLGSARTVPLVGGRELTATLPRNWRSRAKIEIQYTSPLPAPISRGAEVGRLLVSGEGVPDMSVPLLAGADVARLGLPGRAVAVLSRMVGGG